MYEILLSQKYLKYKYQNTCCWRGATSKCINVYDNVVLIKFWLIVYEND